MKHPTIKQLLFMIICCAPIPAAFAADSFAITESQTDSLKSFKESGISYYYPDTSGTFSITAKISASSFQTAGIVLANITANSTIAMSIGSYSFSSTLSATDKPAVIKAKSLSAKWTAYHDGACKDVDCTEYKQVKDTTVSISGNPLQGITLSIAGISNLESTYGSSVFADTCGFANGTVVSNENATLTIDGTPLTVALQVTCKVKVATKIKGGESFDLISSTVKAKKV